MDIKNLKIAAYQAATRDDASMEENLCGLNVQERLYYMQMVYYYRLFAEGKIKLDEAKRTEQKILANYKRIDNALRLSQENYDRQVRLARATDIERTRLSKQLRAGDREYMETLLHLLDLYSGENIYAKLYHEMQPPLTDQEMEDMIAACPEEYRRGMTKEEARTAVWRVIRHLSGDSEISGMEGETVEKQSKKSITA